MERLDQINELKKLDPQNMLDSVYRLPEQIEDASNISYNAELKVKDININKILVLGMGGSAIGGDIIRAIAFDCSKIPLFVNRDYYLPSYVDENTLVFAVSYSGNTVETVNSAIKSYEKGAMVISITSGGRLADFAKEKDLPLIKIPKGLAPRAAIGYVTIPPLVVLDRLGVIPSQKDAIEETINYLRRKREEFKIETPTDKNPAKKLAKMLFERIPIIYSVEERWAVAGYRWKCQFNENSKYPAFTHFFPELNHNEIMSWEADSKIINNLSLIFLYISLDGEMKIRVDFMKEKIESRGIPVFLWQGEGKHSLTKFFSLTYLGDFITVYLAYLAGKDPFAIGFINELKLRIGQSLT
ncbi:MAG: bifunctional phosphoglucose/phosphomannose isomerase [Dictyoglomaceae bacterium]|nr:bifunctional phosphoglucose/phosphomannose isomerase [Dictyoglomaceae bacterium]